MPTTETAPETAGSELRALPPYGRSLLKVQIPIVVQLASTKEKVGTILRLGPGSIIQFGKNCQEPLVLEAGGREIAKGEAVKVGDKFGLWITSVTLPEERFVAVRKTPEA